MQVRKPDIYQRTLAVAARHFAQRGFAKTSMREVAEEVGVGVGNLYRYFPSKDALFCTVLSPALEALEEMLQAHHGDKGEDIFVMRQEVYFQHVVREYLSLIHAHGGLLKILLFQAQGSSLADFRADYARRSIEVVRTWFAEMKQRHPEVNVSVSDFLLRLHVGSMFTLFEELLLRAAAPEDVERIVRDYLLFEINGWRALTKV